MSHVRVVVKGIGPGRLSAIEGIPTFQVCLIARCSAWDLFEKCNERHSLRFWKKRNSANDTPLFSFSLTNKCSMLDASSHLYKRVCPSVRLSVTLVWRSRRWRIELPGWACLANKWLLFLSLPLINRYSGLVMGGLKVVSITDDTPLFGLDQGQGPGPRPRKVRRVWAAW